MARHLERNYYETADLNGGNAPGASPAKPARISFTWKEIFGDAGDENLTSDQTCEINSAQFHAPGVDADEFESVYLWFLA